MDTDVQSGVIFGTRGRTGVFPQLFTELLMGLLHRLREELTKQVFDVSVALLSVRVLVIRSRRF